MPIEGSNLQEPSCIWQLCRPIPPILLPPFTRACTPNCRWGKLEGDEFGHAILAAYAEAVLWKRNIFRTPSGAEGKKFVQNDGANFSSICILGQLSDGVIRTDRSDDHALTSTSEAA